MDAIETEFYNYYNEREFQPQMLEPVMQLIRSGYIILRKRTIIERIDLLLTILNRMEITVEAGEMLKERLNKLWFENRTLIKNNSGIDDDLGKILTDVGTHDEIKRDYLDELKKSR